MDDSDEENKKDYEEMNFNSMVPKYKLRNNDMGVKALKWASICKNNIKFN